MSNMEAIPTAQLRWLIRKNHVSLEQLRAYRLANQASMEDAKKALVQETKPVLQQWWQTSDGAGEWRDVPVVIEPHPLASSEAGNCEDSTRRGANAP